MITKGELKGQILRLLHKSAKNPGYFDDAKFSDAMAEAMDFIAIEMFIADEGWQTKIQYLTTAVGAISVDLPPHMSMVKEVRARVGDSYVPMTYDPAWDAVQGGTASSSGQAGSCYRIIDNALYFNPALRDGGANFLMIEYMAFPQRLINDGDFLESHFNRAMQHYLKYRVASVLASSIEKPTRPWAAEEAQWYQKMLDVVADRNKQITRIREFGDD